MDKAYKTISLLRGDEKKLLEFMEVCYRDKTVNEYIALCSFFVKKNRGHRVFARLVEKTNFFPNSLLHQLVLYDSCVINKSIEDSGVDVNYIDRYGYSALLRVSNTAPGYTEVLHLKAIKLLIKLGADLNLSHNLTSDMHPDYSENNVTPIMFAARSGATSIVKFMLESGADASIIDGSGKSVLDHAKLGLAKIQKSKKTIEEANLGIPDSEIPDEAPAQMTIDLLLKWIESKG